MMRFPSPFCYWRLDILDIDAGLPAGLFFSPANRNKPPVAGHGMKDFRSAVLASALASALALGIAPQIIAHANGSPPTSLADSLRSKGIDLSRPSLLAALRNSDPQVRGLAAMKLAENHDSEAVPAIKNALAVETSPSARIDFGLALWTIKDPDGIVTLRAMCSDASLSIDAIVEVVQELSMIHESSQPCASPVLAFLDSHRDSESRLRSLFALPDLYPWVTPRQAENILQMLVGMLTDEDPAVRMQTAQSLVQIGMPSFEAPIRAQMLRETDPVVRSSLETSLDMLPSIPRQDGPPEH